MPLMSIGYKQVEMSSFATRPCYSACKSTKGHGALFTLGSCDLETGKDKGHRLKEEGWDEPTFLQYLDFLRSLNPKFAPMLMNTTYEWPVIELTDESAVTRFTLMNIFRSVWEHPALAKILLNLWLTDTDKKLHPVDYYLIGAMWHACSGRGNTNHWCMVLLKDKAKTKEELDTIMDVLYNNTQQEVTNVDEMLGMRLVYQYNSTNQKEYVRPANYTDVDQLLELTDQWFWGGQRENYRSVANG